MATCDIQSLIVQACASGFVGQTPQSALAIELQLVKNLSGDISTLEQLKTQACASGFFGQSKRSSKAIELQLWCNIFNEDPSVVTCISVSGAGTISANGSYIYVENGTAITVGSSAPATSYYLFASGNYAILFDIDTWFLGTVNGLGALYSSPNLTGIWTIDDGDSPAPTTTQC